MSNIAEQLSQEVERVTILRERYRAMDDCWDAAKGPHALRPAIVLMTAAIDASHQALGSNNAVEVLKMLVTMKEFAE